MATSHINLYLDDSWKEKLLQIAREKSVKEKRDVSLTGLIKETLNDVYKLD